MKVHKAQTYEKAYVKVWLIHAKAMHGSTSIIGYMNSLIPRVGYTLPLIPNPLQVENVEGNQLGWLKPS